MNDCQKRGHINLITSCEDCKQVIDRATFKEPFEAKGNGWISVKDRLPELGEWVLTWGRGCFIKMYAHGLFYDGDTRLYCPIGGESGIKYWQPLPEPPK